LQLFNILIAIKLFYIKFEQDVVVLMVFIALQRNNSIGIRGAWNLETFRPYLHNTLEQNIAIKRH